MGIIINSAAGAGAYAIINGVHIDNFSIGIVLLVFGFIFFFLLDILNLLSGLRGIKNPRINFFRIIGMIELIGAAYFLVLNYLGI